MPWTPSERNFDGVQFDKLRKVIDAKFNALHDELSDCYYNNKPFRTFGTLTKAQFDKLHGLLFWIRDVKFHEANFAQAITNRIPEEKYNDILDDAGNVINKKSTIAASLITDLKSKNAVLKTIIDKIEQELA
jgi:hypothetical protein